MGFPSDVKQELRIQLTDLIVTDGGGGEKGIF